MVKAYTDAYSSFGVRCLIGSEVPNNAGSLEVITVKAPEGSILNAPYPAAVTSRHIVGQMLPDVIFGCLRQAKPNAVPAEGASCLWNIQLSGGHVLPGFDAGSFLRQPRFSITSFSTGGTGARPASTASTTSFPSGCAMSRWRSSNPSARWCSGAKSTVRIPAAPDSFAAAWDR